MTKGHTIKRLLFLTLISTYSLCVAADSCDSEEHHQFDFWIGDWNVTTPDKKPAGENIITSQQKGCLLKESWISSDQKFTGTSYNFYHKDKRQWQQLWLDNNGGVLELAGNFDGKDMVLRSQPAKNKDGESHYHEIRWTPNPDGSVRQLWQTFVEDNNPTVIFDGLYRKK